MEFKVKIHIPSFDYDFLIKHFLTFVLKSIHLKKHSCTILSCFKIMIIFNNTSADFVLISADVLLKMTTILKELRITQLYSKSEQTLV